MIISKSMQTVDRLRALFIRVITLVLTLIVGVTSTALAQASPGNQASPIESGDISERFEFPNGIQFAPCPEDPTLECGTLNLPVDYRKPHGERFKMAVLRAKATNPAKRIGVLFFNIGPSFSNIDNLLAGLRAQAPAAIRARERFDLIAFDLRGVGRSRPVRCQLEPTKEPTDLDDAALAAFFDDFSRQFAKACLEQNGPFITSLSANNVARDMDMLRRALGEKQINYVGFTGGTIAGAVYASLFPRRVRAMVLDGGIAPEFRDNLVEFASEQVFSFDLTFQRLDQTCQDDPACRLRDTGVVTAFAEVIARLKAAPVESAEGVLLTAGGASNVVATLLPAESQWPLIVDALADALAGDYELFFELLPFARPQPVFGANSFGPVFAYTANDFGTRRSAAEYLPVNEAVSKLSSGLLGNFRVAAITVTATAWPEADLPIIRNVKNRIANPIVIIGNHFDPFSPLSWTRSLARALGMEQSLIRYQGGGINAYAVRGIGCIDSAVEAYLFDLTIPAEGFSCPAQPIRFAPPAAPASADGKQTMDAINRDQLRGQPVRVR